MLKFRTTKMQWIYIVSAVVILSACNSSHPADPPKTTSKNITPSTGIFDSLVAVIKNEYPALTQSPTVTNNSYSSGIHHSAGFVSSSGDHASISIKEFNTDQQAVQFRDDFIHSAYATKTEAGLKKLNIVMGAKPENSSSVMEIDNLVVTITPGSNLSGVEALIRSKFAQHRQENTILLDSGPLHSGN